MVSERKQEPLCQKYDTFFSESNSVRYVCAHGAEKYVNVEE